MPSATFAVGTELFVSEISINFFNNGRNAEQYIKYIMNTRVFERIKRRNITPIIIIIIIIIIIFVIAFMQNIYNYVPRLCC